MGNDVIQGDGGIEDAFAGARRTSAPRARPTAARHAAGGTTSSATTSATSTSSRRSRPRPTARTTSRATAATTSSSAASARTTSSAAAPTSSASGRAAEPRRPGRLCRGSRRDGRAALAVTAVSGGDAHARRTARSPPYGDATQSRDRRRQQGDRRTRRWTLERTEGGTNADHPGFDWRRSASCRVTTGGPTATT